jgi:L,D-transpeptidase catalytic domain
MVKRIKPACSSRANASLANASRAKPAGGLPAEGGWVAAAIGLACLGGMTKPADAYSGYYSDFYSRPSDAMMLPASHRSRKHTDSAKKSQQPDKTDQAAKNPKKDQPKPPSGPLIIVVSIGSQHVTVYDNGTPIATAPVSTGMPGHPTPMGVFSVIQKDRYHHSNIYSNAPMPFMQRITWSGVAMHEGVVPGHPASHGCIRLPHEFAMRLWGMTKMGVRVVVTPRNDVTPVEIDHPRLVAMATKPAAPDVAVTPSHTGQAAPAALPAFTSLAPPSVAPPSAAAATATAPLGEGIDASGDSPLPPFEALALDTRPGDLRPALVTFADPPPGGGAPVAPAMATPERPLRPGLVSVFVSRKLGKLFVRKGNEPIFETAVKIARPETPIGTYVFTAAQPTGDGAKPHWLAMSVASGRATVEPPTKAQEGRGKSRGAREAKPASPEISSTSATEALDRIEIPPEALELISPLVTPGASLIVSDQGISGETGKDTDFIVLVR